MARQHFILASFGSLGDLHPLIAIARALIERGQRVELISFEEYAQPTRAACGENLQYIPVGRWADIEATLKGADLTDWRTVLDIVKFTITAHMRETYDVIAARRQPGTKLVASVMAAGARIASERLGLPLATLQFTPTGIRSARSGHHLHPVNLPLFLRRLLAPLAYAVRDHFVDGALRPEVNAFRAELGLETSHAIERNLSSEDLVIGVFPDWFGPPQSDWPVHTITTHFPLYDAADEAPPRPELDTFLQDGPPPIVFTAGALVPGLADYYSAAVEACRIVERRALIITRHRDDLPTNLPASVAHVDYAPFSKVLPRVAALVHHGGIGTTAQALRAGVPQLVTPWGGDQFDVARRLTQLGVARELSPRACQPARLADALDKLLTDVDSQTNCQEIAARFKGVDLTQQTCEYLEIFEKAQPRRLASPSPASLPSVMRRPG